MKTQLEINAINICKTLQDNGYEAVFAGGCVRDKTWSIEPHDYDIATDATPDIIKTLFENTKEVGESFGVMIVIIDKHNQYEVATYRTEESYTDGRRPDKVKFSTMEEDALRRDFTINGTFYDPINCKTFDYIGGARDFLTKTLRFIGNPEDRIKEDHLRILRAIRFIIKYDLNVDEDTAKALLDNGYLIEKIAKERIQLEFNKMLEIGSPRQLIHNLDKYNLIQYIVPPVKAMLSCRQDPRWHSEGSTMTHTILCMEALIDKGKKDYRHQLAGLLHDIGKPLTTVVQEDGRITAHGHDKVGEEIARELLIDLKYSNDDIEFICFLIGNHMRILNVKDMRKSKLKRLLASEHIGGLLSLYEADCKASIGKVQKAEFLDYLKIKMEEFGKIEEQPLRLPECFVNGFDLIELGYKPGKLFSEILKEVSNLQLEDKFENKEEMLIYIEENYKI